MRDPYTVLGVPRDADADTIKKAYKKLARKYHPDLNKDPGADEQFKEVNAAFDILKDPEARRRFDTFGSADGPGPSSQQGHGFSGFGDGFGANGGVDIDDLLSSMFGAGASRRGGRRGSDYKASLRLDPMTSFTGGETSVTVTLPGGSEQVLRVRIPAGVTHGGTLRLRGRGGPGRGDGPAGDLVLDLAIDDHPLLQRDGDNLRLDVPVTLGEAARGATITVPTPAGEVSVKVPPGATDGQKLRIRGKGVQRQGRPGDLLLILRIQMPDQLDDEALTAIDLLERKYSEAVRRGLRL
jgi:curved DNA-binding protein